MGICIIYARTSKDDEQGESHSIPDQVAACRRLAEDKGHQILKVVTEPNRSGRLYPTGCPIALHDNAVIEYTKGWKYKTRDGLARALGYLSEVDYVLVRDEERLARPLTNSMLGSFMAQQLVATKTKILSVADGVRDPANWETQFVSTVKYMTEDQAINKRLTNSILKLRKKKDEGYVNRCPTMFGYRYSRKQEVNVVEDQAKIVREIFEMAQQETPFNRIARNLNGKYSDKEWSIREILKILDRPEYFGWTRDTKGKLIKSRVYPALLSEFDIWKQIQVRRKKNRKRKGCRRDKTHPLSGLLKCGFCGRNLLIQTAPAFGDKKKVSWYYQCPRSYAHDSDQEDVVGCRWARIPEWSIIQFSRAFLSLRPDRSEMLTSKEICSKSKDLETERERLVKLENKLVEADLGQNQKLRQIKRIGDQIDAVERQLAELSQLPKRPDRLTSLDPLNRRVIRMSSADADELSELFPEIIDYIKIWAFALDLKLRSTAELRIERVPHQSGRRAPYPLLGFDSQERPNVIVPYKSCHLKRSDRTIDGKELGVGSLTPIPANGGPSETTVRLYANLEREVLLDTDEIKVVTIGRNPAYGERKRLRGEDVKSLPNYVLQSRRPKAT